MYCLEIVFKYYGKYLYFYLNTVLIQVFAIVFVFGKFIVFVFVFGPKSGNTNLLVALVTFEQ